MSNRNLSYGIDFGTTNSSVSFLDRSGELRVLPIDAKAVNPTIVRSVIYLSPKRKFYFGGRAIAKYLEEIGKGKPWETEMVFTGKYLEVTKPFGMGGYRGEEMVPEIIEVEVNPGGRLFQSLKTALSLRTISSFKVFDKKYLLEDLIGSFFKYLKDSADSLMGEEINRVVIGRPVHFIGEDDDLAQDRLMKSAKIAGFGEIKFELEPIGAAWEYGFKAKKKKQIILVFDFGGGTLDFSVVSFPEREILANYGLSIGGDLFNSEIFSAKLARYFGSNAKYGELELPFPGWIYKRLKGWYQISLLKTKKFMNTLEFLRYRCSDIKAIEALRSLVVYNLGFALYEEIDRVKRELSYKNEEVLVFEKEKIDIHEILARSSFEKIIADFLDDVSKGIDEVIDKAGLNIDEIDYLITTGGSSLIPAVELMLVGKFGKDKIKSRDYFTSVATGLALRASELFK